MTFSTRTVAAIALASATLPPESSSTATASILSLAAAPERLADTRERAASLMPAPLPLAPPPALSTALSKLTNKISNQ